MNIEELLKPRWKVISSFPGGEWLKIGEILVLRDLGEYVDDWDSLLPENYPAIFQKIEWFNDLEQSNFRPQFLRRIDNNQIYCVIEYGFPYSSTAAVTYFPSGKKYFEHLSKFIPATNDEFNSQNPPNNERSSK